MEKRVTHGVRYPALYISADIAAQKQQRSYFALLAVQFLILLVASISSAVLRNFNPELASRFYFICLCFGAATTFYATLKVPERDWYFARALAESAKTLSWLYMMSAQPFERGMKPSVAVAEYTSALSEILTTNRDSGRILAMSISPGSQITDEMVAIRSMELTRRREIYITDRIDNQLEWYTKNAKKNADMANLVGFACIAIYSLGLVVAAINLSYGESANLSALGWITDPLLVIATSMIGWMQAKRYSELAATYSLAMHEIAQVRDNVVRAETEKEFVRVVKDSEAAFSREHTQWTARQMTRVERN